MPMDTSYGMMEPCASQGRCSSTSPTGSHFQNGTNYPNSHQDYEIDGQQQKKLFIGGLHWRTEDDDLRNYFQTFGQLTDAMVSVSSKAHFLSMNNLGDQVPRKAEVAWIRIRRVRQSGRRGDRPPPPSPPNQRESR